jgi:hypothetical protein
MVKVVISVIMIIKVASEGTSCLHDWKEDYRQQSQPPACGAPLGEQKFEFGFLSTFSHTVTNLCQE